MSHVTCLNNHGYGFMNRHEMSLLECGTMRGNAARRACGYAPGMPTACLLGENNLWLTNHTQELQGTSRDTATIVVVTAAAATTEDISPNWFGVWKILKVPQVWTKFGYKQI